MRLVTVAGLGLATSLLRLVTVTGLSLAASLMLPEAVAWAHSGGVNGSGCGCHGQGDVGLDVTTNPAMISPGQQVTVTVTVSSSSADEAGLFVDANDVGNLGTIAGQGVAVVSNGLTHTQPKGMSGDSASFSFSWTAPNSPGAVRFEVWAVAANGNNSSSGDDSDDGVFDFVYGCAPQTYYRDFDGDGYGRTTLPLIHCAGAPPDGYAALPDDCDDNRSETYPGATEYCNLIDDDCDGEIDEDALPVDQYPDADGDGFYSLAEYESGEMYSGCVPTEGWAAEPGDCRPDDPLINPGVEEVCNGFDDDCDADVDERVRPQCGEGWCRRESINCEQSACTPGEPREEECNFFDDDCDGLVDEDSPCPAGEVCQAGECRPAAPVADGTGDGGGEVGGSTMGSGTTGASEPTGSSGGAGQDGGGGCTIVSATRGDAPWGLGLLLVLLAARRRHPLHEHETTR